MSIQDPLNGQQPVISHSKKHVLVLNGEIYNHTQLREQYLNGIAFHTNSDAETATEMIERYGLKKSLNLFNGMFSLAIYNIKTRSLSVARDRFGIKPLYYSKVKNQTIFASEVSAISTYLANLKSPRNASISEYLVFWYICEPWTIYDNIYSLTPGHILEIEPDKDIREERWWIPNLQKIKESRFNAYVDELDHLISDSVRLRLLSDQPVTCLMSGGLDSTLIASYIKDHATHKISAFTLTQEFNSYDESADALTQAKYLGIDLQKYQQSEPSFEDLYSIFATLDQPLGNASFIGSHNIFSHVSQEGYKVCLTGDGADEILSLIHI